MALSLFFLSCFSSSPLLLASALSTSKSELKKFASTLASQTRKFCHFSFFEGMCTFSSDWELNLMGGLTLPFTNSEQALHLKNVIMWRYYQPSDSPRVQTRREKSSQKNFQQLATPFAHVYTLVLCLTNKIYGCPFFNRVSLGLFCHTSSWQAFCPPLPSKSRQ